MNWRMAYRWPGLVSDFKDEPSSGKRALQHTADTMENGEIVMDGPNRNAKTWDVYGRPTSESPDYNGFLTSSSSPAHGASQDTTAAPPDLEESNRVMEQHFDFDSAANSPGSMTRPPNRPSPSMPAFAQDGFPETSDRRSRPASGIIATADMSMASLVVFYATIALKDRS